jgi:hypothetical protein
VSIRHIVAGILFSAIAEFDARPPFAHPAGLTARRSADARRWLLAILEDP